LRFVTPRPRGIQPLQITAPHVLGPLYAACALDADTDLIVSGDKHLLVLAMGKYEGVRILTVPQFLDSLVG